MIVDIASYLASALGISALAYLVFLAARPDQERYDEDDARLFFDEHGRWPDEPDSAAVPRAEGSYADVDLLPRP